MSDTTLFSTEPATPANVEPAPPTAASLPADVAELVGEGKKYKSVEDALKALPHAQSHIARLEMEAKDLREQAIKARAIEDVYEALQSHKEPSPATPVAQSFDEKTIDAILERKLLEQKAIGIKQTNMEVVRQALTDKFLEKAPEVFKQKAEELGVNEAFLTEVIAASSKAGLDLFGLVGKESQRTASPAGNVNAQAFSKPPEKNTVPPFLRGKQGTSLIEQWRAAKP